MSVSAALDETGGGLWLPYLAFLLTADAARLKAACLPSRPRTSKRQLHTLHCDACDINWQLDGSSSTSHVTLWRVWYQLATGWLIGSAATRPTNKQKAAQYSRL